MNFGYQILPVDNKKLFTKYVIIKNKLKQGKRKKLKEKKNIKKNPQK